jgi:drug/metabolite transporter (DMT)-like permease
VAIVYALVAALVYGVSDYAGGRASRFSAAINVTVLSEVVILGGLLVVVPLVGDPLAPARDLMWGALAGVGGVVGIVALYYALANGAMTVVAPITGVVAAVVPVVVGLLLGERPAVIALVGIVLAVGAVALIGGAIGVPHVPTPTRLVVIAFVSGAGFGLLFVFYSRASDESGLWPLLAARATSLPLLLATLVVRRRPWSMTAAAARLAVVVGVLATTANASYLAATRRGLLSVVAVVASMYPASTVALAWMLDGERLRRPQLAGMALAAVALLLVTLGR